MIIHFVLFAIGFICLIKGGDWFVDASVNIAHFFHMPELLIGATIVSIGTTLPEVMVSTTSAISAHSEIAYGNAIGSIICNTALIAALSILIRPGKVKKSELTLPICFFYAAAAVFLVYSYFFKTFTRTAGVIFLAIFVIYMVVTVRSMSSSQKTEAVSTDGNSSIGKNIGIMAVGAIIIAVGARLLINHGTEIARFLGVPESVIGLTMIALGTSLPELITAIISLKKGHSALSLGNIIGANLFNLVLVCGLSITLSPFALPASAQLFGHSSALIFELPVMLLVMLILTIPSLIKQKTLRIQGLALIIIYIIFVSVQFSLQR